MEPRTLWSHTPLSWEDLRRVLAAGALEARVCKMLCVLCCACRLTRVTLRAQKLVRSHELCERYNDATEQARRLTRNAHCTSRRKTALTALTPHARRTCARC